MLKINCMTLKYQLVVGVIFESYRFIYSSDDDDDYIFR